MEISFKIKGNNEAELEAAAKKVMTDFNDYNPNDWSWEITAEAQQDDQGKIMSWDGTVQASRTVSKDDDQTR